MYAEASSAATMSEGFRRWRGRVMAAALLCLVPAVLAGADSVYLEELTSTELRDRIVRGDTTVLVPIGGTEQNGAHMVLGKHNVRVNCIAPGMVYTPMV